MIGVYPEDYAQIGNLSCGSLLLVESIGRQSLRVSLRTMQTLIIQRSCRLPEADLRVNDNR